jgi:hypothetical protein
MSHKQSTPLEIVELYIRHTSNEGDADWIPSCVRIRFDATIPNSVTEMTHSRADGPHPQQQRASTRAAFPHGGPARRGPVRDLVWEMTVRTGDKRLCGIEVFKVENGLITDLWNAPYAQGAWG